MVRIHSVYALIIISDILYMFPLKLISNSSLMLCINGLFIVSSISPELNEWLWWNGYLAFDKISCICLCDIFMYMWLHFPMVMCIVSTIYIIFECWFISGLVKSVFERSLSGKKSQFLSKSGFVVTLEFIFYNLGTFWVLTNWRHCRGKKLHIFPGENDKVEERFLWANMNFYQ